MTELPHFDRRMSDAEALMWRMDKDPYLSSTFCNITVLDRSPDIDRLRRRLDRATRIIPRLRQRVQSMPGNLAPPMWVDDPNFDLLHHVRHISLPKPGTMRQLLDLTTLMENDPFDRTRPLWQFVIVDGLRGGKSALVQKLHHAIIDGEAGVMISMQFLDLERDAPEPPPLGPEFDEVVEATSPATDILGEGDVLRELLSGTFRLPLGLLRHVKDLLADPGGIGGAGADAARTLREIVQQLGDSESAQSPLWTARSLHKRIEVLRTPFAPTMAAAKRLGGTLNTAFITAAADAAGRYHRKMGAPVEHLRTSMVVSTRTEQSGSNAFSLARLSVPTGEMSPAERFAAIQAAALDAKSSTSGASVEAIAGLTAALPTSVVTRLGRQQTQTIDFATSNVKGAPFPLYVAGAKVVQNHPVGPLLGVAFNLTLLSYDGSLDMGVNIDTAAVSDPELLRTCLEQAFTAFQKA